MNASVSTRLLDQTDPTPVDVLHADSTAPVLLLCEHAGRAIPRRLGDLGVSDAIRCSHRAWDIGAEGVARGLAARLGAPLVVQRYSRLVIDANRPPGSTESFPVITDKAEIPGNINLTPRDKTQRIDEIFAPMAQAVERCFDSHPRRAGFSIHSFTRDYGNETRPWHAGFLARQDLTAATALRDTIARLRPDLTLALNEPYQIEDATDWFIPVQAEPRGLAHCLIEIRNDQLETQDGIDLWVDLLAQAIRPFMEPTK